MKILTTAQYEVIDYISMNYPHLCEYHGWLNTPKNAYCFERLASYDMPIACDNSAFIDFSAKRYITLINRVSVPILWITLPDVVGCATETNRLWQYWREQVFLPRAYVGQDGIEDLEIPFEDITCLFIGGSTKWKLSESAADVARESKKHGKLVHMGRVNSDKRLRYAYELGCDSVDGTGYSKYSKRELLPGLRFLDGLHRQLPLF